MEVDQGYDQKRMAVLLGQRFHHDVSHSRIAVAQPAVVERLQLVADVFGYESHLMVIELAALDPLFQVHARNELHEVANCFAYK